MSRKLMRLCLLIVNNVISLVREVAVYFPMLTSKLPIFIYDCVERQLVFESIQELSLQ